MALRYAAVPAGLASPAGSRPPSDAAGDASLLALVDHLAAFLERSDLTELEVEAGGTGLVLRKPAAIAYPATAAGLPVGMQLIADQFEEGKLIKISHKLEESA